MRRYALLAMLFLAAGPVVAAPPQSDDEIREKLLGNWVSVQTPEQIPDHLLIRFAPGGTARAWFFKDGACKDVLARADVRWRIEGGVLITSYPEGYSDHDVVADIGDKTITFNSVERREPYTRARSETCQPPKDF